MFRPKYRNLVIIGNGFDRWQNLPTSFENFRSYYYDHIEEAVDLLDIPKETIPQIDGTVKLITPVELIYGDPFDPDMLPPEFFWSFEASLDKIDDQKINLYFGRKATDIQALGETVDQAQALLRHLFSQWILALDVTTKYEKLRFKKDCFFINFNYTDTLEKRFGIDHENIYYIHGSASHPNSIVFGHATHPETAFRELIEHHMMKPLPGQGLPRLEGLYMIEDALYRTDKHVEDHIDLLCKAFMDAGVHIEEIENIYVLGQSFGDPDLRYFEYLDQVTRCGCYYDSISAAGRLDMDKLALISMLDDEMSSNLLMEEIHLNFLYACHHRERVLGKPPIPFPKHEAIEKLVFGVHDQYDRETAEAAARSVHQRFLFEQAGRTHDLLTKIMLERGLGDLPEGCHSVLGLADYLDGGHEPRYRNAQWHISYFTPADKKRIKDIMKKLRLKRYQLYEGIDQCVEGCTVKT